MAIKNFKSFNESIEMTDQDKEDLKWYLENGYVKDDKFNSPEELLDFIKNNIGDAFNKMASRNRIPIKNAKIVIDDKTGKSGGSSYYIRLYSDPITDLGIFKKCLKSAHFNFFSGKEISFVTKNNHFLFKPVIWTSLNIAYESISGGGNGLNYVFDPGTDFQRSDIWYNILLNVFETEKEAMIRKKPILGSKKLKKLGDKTGIFSEDEEILPPVSLS